MPLSDDEMRAAEELRAQDRERRKDRRRIDQGQNSMPPPIQAPKVSRRRKKEPRVVRVSMAVGAMLLAVPAFSMMLGYISIEVAQLGGLRALPGWLWRNPASFVVGLLLPIIVAAFAATIGVWIGWAVGRILALLARRRSTLEP